MNSTAFWCGVSCAVLSLGFGAMPAVAQDFPDPSDEAALYEAARQEGRLVWYESAPLEPMRAVADAFEQRYPGITVDVMRIVGVQQYQRFLQETAASQHIADILHISDYPSMVDLIEQGHLVEWRTPEGDRIPEEFRIGYSAYANYTTDVALVYNRTLVTEEEVELLGSSWTSILDPRFKGRFATTTMKCGTCYAIIHMFLDPQFEDEFGMDFLEAIAEQEPAVYSEILVGLDRTIAGEHAFTFAWEGVGNTNWQRGAPIGWIRPDPTPEFGNSWQGISKYAPNPNAARLFQNWSMSEEGAYVLQQLYGSATTMEGIEDKREVTNEPWYRPINERYNVDFDRWARDYHTDMDAWIAIQQTIRR